MLLMISITIIMIIIIIIIKSPEVKTTPEVNAGARCSFMVRSSDRSFMVDPLSYILFHDWCNKGRGMCYPVCGMVHIKQPLLLIGKSRPCSGSRFPLSLSEWSFTMSDAI